MASDEGKLMGSNMMKVEIQSRKWIKPSTPTPPHLHRLQLSSIDQLQPPVFIKLIFHFDIGNETTTPDQRLARLEESLSEVLTLYYPFAGRCINNEDDNSLVLCQDQGAEFVVATVDRKLDELVDGEYDNLVNSLQSLSTRVASTPLLSVQVNIFNCGGLAIGVGLFHKVCDMFAFSMFMDAWATACRLGTLDQVVRPNFRISFVFPPKLSKSRPPPSVVATAQLPPPKFVMKRYIFTGEAISKLKKSTISISESELNTTSTNYTRVELVSAVIIRGLIEIERSKHAQLIIRPKFLISHAMNMRSRTALPIEENLCGNFSTNVVAAREVVVENEESWELRELAGFIRNSIRNVASEIGKVGDWSELSQMVEKSFLEFKQGWSEGEKMNPVIFSSWCRFGLNEVDFGWGRPGLVSTLPAPLVLINLMDHYKSGVDDGGIEAWVRLKEEDMARFQYVPDILEYASL